jgi:acetyltransferase-like isoleucine patch superfamily enzyme
MSAGPMTVQATPKRLSARLREDVLGRARFAVLELATSGLSSGGRCSVGPRSRFRLAPSGTVRLGADVAFRGDAQIAVQGECTFGDRVFVNRWFYLSAFASVEIGSDVRIGERVSIHDENHASTGDDYHVAAVTVRDRAWLGAGVVVLPGVTIGADAVVAAGAVVTRDVPDRTLVAGVPAKVVRDLSPAAPR